MDDGIHCVNHAFICFTREKLDFKIQGSYYANWVLRFYISSIYIKKGIIFITPFFSKNYN